MEAKEKPRSPKTNIIQIEPAKEKLGADSPKKSSSHSTLPLLGPRGSLNPDELLENSMGMALKNVIKETLSSEFVSLGALLRQSLSEDIKDAFGKYDFFRSQRRSLRRPQNEGRPDLSKASPASSRSNLDVPFQKTASKDTQDNSMSDELRKMRSRDSLQRSDLSREVHMQPKFAQPIRKKSRSSSGQSVRRSFDRKRKSLSAMMFDDVNGELEDLRDQQLQRAIVRRKNKREKPMQEEMDVWAGQRKPVLAIVKENSDLYGDKSPIARRIKNMSQRETQNLSPYTSQNKDSRETSPVASPGVSPIVSPSALSPRSLAVNSLLRGLSSSQASSKETNTVAQMSGSDRGNAKSRKSVIEVATQPRTVTMRRSQSMPVDDVLEKAFGKAFPGCQDSDSEGEAEEEIMRKRSQTSGAIMEISPRLQKDSQFGTIQEDRSADAGQKHAPPYSRGQSKEKVAAHIIRASSHSLGSAISHGELWDSQRDDDEESAVNSDNVSEVVNLEERSIQQMLLGKSIGVVPQDPPANIGDSACSTVATENENDSRSGTRKFSMPRPGKAGYRQSLVLPGPIASGNRSNRESGCSHIDVKEAIKNCQASGDARQSTSFSFFKIKKPMSRQGTKQSMTESVQSETHSETRSHVVDSKIPSWDPTMSTIAMVATTTDLVHADIEHFVQRNSIQSTDAHMDAVCWRPKSIWHLQAARMVESQAFDSFIICIVVLNAMTIGYNADWAVRYLPEKPPASPLHLRIVESVFCIVFVIELGIRIFVYRQWFLKMDDWCWNIFDSVIVVLQVIDECLSLSALFSDDSSLTNSNLNFMRILRVVRLVRIVRLARLLRFVRELRTMVTSIGGSLRSLGWTIVLMLLMIYVYGIFLTMLIADHGDWTNDDEKVRAIQYYYGTLFRAILSLFQAITGGADWDDMVEPLIQGISPFTGVLFLLYIAFAVLAMMNVVTAVFVENALATANSDKEQHLVAQLRELFVTADEDQSGMISWEEFERKLDDESMVKYFKALELDVCEAKGLFTLLDVDNVGEILIEEFVSGCLRLRGGAKAIDLATLMYYNKRMSSNMRAHCVYIEEMLEEVMDLMEDSMDNSNGEHFEHAVEKHERPELKGNLKDERSRLHKGSSSHAIALHHGHPSRESGVSSVTSTPRESVVTTSHNTAAFSTERGRNLSKPTCDTVRQTSPRPSIARLDQMMEDFGMGIAAKGVSRPLQLPMNLSKSEPAARRLSGSPRKGRSVSPRPSASMVSNARPVERKSVGSADSISTISTTQVIEATSPKSA